MEFKGQYSEFYGGFAKVYGLYDEYGNIFYIGCTMQTMAHRLAGHLSESRISSKKHAKLEKIRSLLGQVFIRELDIIWVTSPNSNVLPQAAIDLENYWIKKYFDAGVELTNSRECCTPSKKEFDADYKMWVNKVQTEQHLTKTKYGQLVEMRNEKSNQVLLF